MRDVAGGHAAKQSKTEISNLTWCVGTLLLLYVIGGAIFSWLERDAELEHYRRNRFLYQQMRDMYELEKCKEDWFKDMEFCQKQRAFNDILKDFFERNGNQMEDHSKWTFFGAMFYVSTLVTTLGYGNLHPTTPAGQLFTVIFGLIGIPLMGYVLSHAGAFVVEVWMPMCPTIETRTRRFVVLGSLFVGLVLLGGGLYVLLEGWPVVGSLYFSACTLMSVGFGDYLPSHVLSRLVTMVFVMLGLGVAAAFIALLQLHVEVRGERFAKRLGSWYDSVAERGSSTPRHGHEVPPMAPQFPPSQSSQGMQPGPTGAGLFADEPGAGGDLLARLPQGQSRGSEIYAGHLRGHGQGAIAPGSMRREPPEWEGSLFAAAAPSSGPGHAAAPAAAPPRFVGVDAPAQLPQRDVADAMY